MTSPTQTPEGDPVETTEEAAPLVAEETALLDRAARRRAKKLRRKAEKAAARAAAEAAEAEADPAEPLDHVDDVETPKGPGFEVFALRPDVLESVAEQGFEEPTPIQFAAIPPLLEGRDVVGQAQTGTGKTAAYALPMLQRIDPARQTVQAFVLVPTRELANQVSAALMTLARPLGGVSVIPVYGGQSIYRQFQQLKRGVHVVVGTPGRIMDHLRRETLSLTDATMVVLDEADEMLKMGFIEDVEWILEHAPGPESRQTALFSATLPPPVRRVAERHLTEPVSIAIEPDAPAISTIDQRFLWVREDQKFAVLCRILELDEGDSTLIFTRTRVDSSDLSDALSSHGFAAEALHGDMSQAHRESVLRRLRSGAVRIVVATDVAARGLDVDTLTLVVNFDAPGDAETYVHRIGRTGRAGRAGVSVLFLDPREGRVLAGVQRYTRQRLLKVQPPTQHDVALQRVDRFKAAVEQTIATEETGNYRSIVEEIASEGSHDMTAVAAAVAQMAAEHRPLDPQPEPEPEPAPESREAYGREPRGQGPKRVTLVLSVGAEAGVGPADIVGAIANQAGIPGRAVGAIRIDKRVTFADVAVEHVKRVLDRLEGVRIRGCRTHIRPAHPGEMPGQTRFGTPARRDNDDGGWNPPRRGRR